MTLTEERVKNQLAPRPVRFYEQVNSTNDLALAWLNEGAPAGAAVVADEQVKGRGRLGRSWYTPPGTALIVSVILRPRADDLPRMTMLGAVAIAEMLDKLGAANVGIKWPNDVQLNERKVSGILPEAVWEGGALRGIVLGMGINVRIDFSGTALSDTAISIEPAIGRTVDRLVLLSELLERIDYWASRAGSNDLFDHWKRRLNTLGQYVRLTTHDSNMEGTAEDVDRNGALLIRQADGGLRRALAGDIALGSER